MRVYRPKVSVRLHGQQISSKRERSVNLYSHPHHTARVNLSAGLLGRTRFSFTYRPGCLLDASVLECLSDESQSEETSLEREAYLPGQNLNFADGLREPYRDGT